MMRMVPDLYLWDVSIYVPSREKLRMTPSDAQIAQVLAYGRHVIAASVRLREATRFLTLLFIVDCRIFSPWCLTV